MGVKTFFYTYADPLRRGLKAAPDYVFPKLVEAEKLMGYEFTSLSDQHPGGPHACGRWERARW